MLHLGKSTTYGRLWFECFQPPLDISGELCVPTPALFPLVLSMFLVEHVAGNFRLLILVVPCRMEVPWLPKVLSMLKDVHCHFPIIKHVTMDDLVDWVLKGLKSPYPTLWLLRDVCCAGKGSLSQSIRQWWGLLEHHQQRVTSSAGKNGQIGVLEIVYQRMAFCP